MCSMRDLQVSLGLCCLFAAPSLVGAFMVSYTTAKAEAMNVLAARGAMRRSERATF